MATFTFLGDESEKEEKGGVMIRTTKTKVLKERKKEAKANGCVSYRS